MLPTLEMPSNRSFLERSFERVATPLENFVFKQTTAGILLLVAALVSVTLANSPWKFYVDKIAEIELGLVFQQSRIVLSLYEWIASGLMALFFFLIGLEIKRELLVGQLRHFRQVAPILMAAAGGIITPATIYWLFNANSAGAHGWAIPMATDTAFAIAALALCTRGVSRGMAIFLAALAIFDDIGAILIVALFYTRQLDSGYLLSALIPFTFLITLNIIGVRRGLVYFVAGLVLWWLIHQSGVHATVAGILMALTIPARVELGQSGFTEKMKAALSVFEKKLDFGLKILESSEQHSLAMDIERTVKSAVTPLQRWHSQLLNPVGIIVLPIFALFSAGVSLSGSSISTALSSPVAVGVAAGLVFGKPLGVVCFTLLALKLGIGILPRGMSLREVIAVGLLSGIGFTMSLFVTALSFEPRSELVEPAKIGIIFGSLVSAAAALIWSFSSKPVTSEK